MQVTLPSPTKPCQALPSREGQVGHGHGLQALARLAGDGRDARREHPREADRVGARASIALAALDAARVGAAAVGAVVVALAATRLLCVRMPRLAVRVT